MYGRNNSNYNKADRERGLLPIMDHSLVDVSLQQHQLFEQMNVLLQDQHIGDLVQ